MLLVLVVQGFLTSSRYIWYKTWLRGEGEPSQCAHPWWERQDFDREITCLKPLQLYSHPRTLWNVSILFVKSQGVAITTWPLSSPEHLSGPNISPLVSHQCFTRNFSCSKEPAMLAYFTTTFLVAWTPSSSWESSLPGSEYDSVTSSNAVLE